VRGRRVHARDAQLLAHLRDRHLQVLEHADQPLHPADVLVHRLDATGDLRGVQRIVDAPVRGEAVPELVRQPVGRLARDQGQVHAGHARGGLGEPRRRVEQVRRHKGDKHHAPVKHGRA